MKRQMMNRIIKKSTAAAVAAGMLCMNIFSVTAFAAAPSAEVEEKLYVNMDAYGGIDKANVVKGIRFGTEESYTDYGKYTEITNMSDTQKPKKNADSVTWNAPEKGGTFYFQGGLDPDDVVMPWKFDVTYKLNGVVSTPEQLAGASGTVEIDIDAVPDKSVSKYMQDNYLLMIVIPMDTSNVYSIDAPDSMEAGFGNYSGIAFEALPGKEGHFTARFGSDKFESMGVMMIMTPATVSDLSKIKDLKEIEDKFRDNTNVMMDSVEAIMDNVSDMSSQLEKTNKVLDELAGGKAKIDQNRTIIFNGIDVSLQDLRDLSALLDPLDTSLKTMQWMVYDLNKNLNTMDAHLVNSSAVMSTLSRKLRTLSSEMAVSNTYNISSVEADVLVTKTALDELMNDMQRGGAAYGNILAISGSDTFQKQASGAVTDAAVLGTEYEEEYLPEAVIEVINSSIPDKTAVTAEQLKAQTSSVAYLLNIYDILADPALIGESYTAVAKGTPTNAVYDVSPKSASDQAYSVTASDLDSFAKALTKAQAGDTSAVYAAISAFAGKNKITDNATMMSLAMRLMGLASGPAPEYTDKASRFTGRMTSMIDLKNGVSTLAGSTAFTGTSLAGSLNSLSDVSLEIIADAAAAYGSVDYDDMFTLLETTVSDMDDLLNAGSAVSYQTSRLLDSLRKVIADIDQLTGIMNSYYEDVQTAMTNASNLIEETEKLVTDMAETGQVLNNTLRAASEDLSRAGDDSIEVGREAVENAGKMIDNTEKMKNAGADLRKTINDELDKQEEENNFLNMDPDAAKESLTSSKNKEPKTVSIICRTAEISIAEDKAETADSEIAETPATLAVRVANVFKTMWSTIKGLFGK
ncbi:MAG: hypothetical protein Q4E57_09540 [Eubacteriales bacterium]|nr:hypothetical protein [Eubacteriales bacterium]